jgi:hypothetical protein
METSTTIGKLSTALAKAQGEIRGATKDSTNPHFRSKYADLASVRDAIQDALSKHSIAYMQFPEGGPETITITTILACGEEWMRASYQMRPVKSDPQGMGSAITYARRYALMAAVGVAPEDDDGNAASNPKNGQGAGPARTEPVKVKPPEGVTKIKAELSQKLRDIYSELDAPTTVEEFDTLMGTKEMKASLKAVRDVYAKDADYWCDWAANLEDAIADKRRSLMKPEGAEEPVRDDYLDWLKSFRHRISLAATDAELRAIGDEISGADMFPPDKQDLRGVYAIRQRELSAMRKAA